MKFYRCSRNRRLIDDRATVKNLIIACNKNDRMFSHRIVEFRGDDKWVLKDSISINVSSFFFDGLEINFSFNGDVNVTCRLPGLGELLRKILNCL